MLHDHELLNRPVRLEWPWFVSGVGALGVTTRLALFDISLSDRELPERILACRPVGQPKAEFLSIKILGSGTYLDAAGRRRSEDRLVELIVETHEANLSARLSVHHDIWADYDFFGRPHFDIYERNAPRLTAALQALDEVLGVTADPGDSTYFGAAEGYGLARTDPEDLIDGLGIDRSDKL
ncbi:hypothetical protein GCM10023082_66230 [Streptomyces tremellae]|uniref:Uncharacterized protein n=1 Tax=Streptomyces tremellae TaxID=1124239 RepID=A0ABP7GI41_9ACTN